MQKKNIDKTNVHKEHRKRMKRKFFKSGIENFSEHEILEFLLFFSIPQGDTNTTAHNLINKFGNIANVLDAMPEDLQEVNGIGEHSSTLITFLPQLFKTYQQNKFAERKQIVSYLDAYTLASKMFCNSVTEELIIVCLDANNNVMDTKLITQNLVDKVEIEMRNISNFILKSKCIRILLMHNHPSEILEFSQADLDLTHRIYSVCLLNGVDIVDHILYTHNGCTTMSRENLLNNIKNDVINRLTISNSNFDITKVKCLANPKTLNE